MHAALELVQPLVMYLHFANDAESVGIGVEEVDRNVAVPVLHLTVGEKKLVLDAAHLIRWCGHRMSITALAD